MRKGCLSVLLSMGVAAANAASFNCTRAATPQERAICASPELSSADDRMAAAYRDLLAAAPAGMKPEIRAAQREWLHGMAEKCKEGESSSNLSTCLRGYLDSRTKALHGMVLRFGGVTFVWRSFTLTASQPAANPAAAKDGPDNPGPDNLGPGKLEGSWPQATLDTPQWKAWNKAIEAQAQTMAAGGKPGSGGTWPSKWDAESDTTIGASVGLVSDQLVTAAMNAFTYSHGAAHPNNDSIQFNWLLKQQRELRPEDVFRSGSGWDQALQSQCDRYLRKTLGDDYADFLPNQMPTVLHGIVVNPRNWRLDSKGLTIVFQTYAVACRACTPDPLTIPWDELKPLLNPDFAAPK